MTVTIISPTRVIVSHDALGELYAIFVNGSWLWDKSGRLCGYSVVRAIERAMRGAA